MAATSIANDAGRYEARLRNLLVIQFVLAAIGAVALVAVALAVTSKLAELEQLQAQREHAVADLAAIADKKREAEEALRAIEQDYATLKANTEKLYAVNVTRDNRVYAVKASAQATGKQSASGPIYDFQAYIDAPDEDRAQIAKVVYRFEHETFRQPVVEVTDPSTRFKVDYRGWGCLNNVGVTIQLKTGETKSLDFNMCKSIGWE